MIVPSKKIESAEEMFGKPASLLAAIIFTVGFVSGLITLIVSAIYPCVGTLLFFVLFFRPSSLLLDLSDLSQWLFVCGIRLGDPGRSARALGLLGHGNVARLDKPQRV
jgi:hypothetical protein